MVSIVFLELFGVKNPRCGKRSQDKRLRSPGRQLLRAKREVLAMWLP